MDLEYVRPKLVTLATTTVCLIHKAHQYELVWKGVGFTEVIKNVVSFQPVGYL